MATRAFRLLSSARARMPTIITPARVGFAAGFVAGMPIVTGEQFFEHKFITTKSPDDIVDFYSTEDFLQILGIFPMALNFVLSGVQWDLEKENTMTVHNAMEISFTLTEREETTESGDTVVAFFQKEERFKNFIPFTKIIMWDQTQQYGYERRDDGTCEVCHRGKVFFGPLPVRWIIQAHARYVIWATEKHINSPAFGNGNLEMQEHQRSNVPAHVFNDFLQRLQLAQQVALESGKIVAGGSTEDAQKTLKQIKKLQARPTERYVNAVRKSNLKRTQSNLEITDPEAKFVVESALSSLSSTKEGQVAAAAALNDLLKHPDVVKEEPRYGGAFQGRLLKRQPSVSS